MQSLEIPLSKVRTALSGDSDEYYTAVGEMEASTLAVLMSVLLLADPDHTCIEPEDKRLKFLIIQIAGNFFGDTMWGRLHPEVTWRLSGPRFKPVVEASRRLRLHASRADRLKPKLTPPEAIETFVTEVQGSFPELLTHIYEDFTAAVKLSPMQPVRIPLSEQPPPEPNNWAGRMAEEMGLTSLSPADAATLLRLIDERGSVIARLAGMTPDNRKAILGPLTQPSADRSV